MRMGIVVVGIVLLVIGAVLLFIPISGQGTQTVSGSAPSAFSVSGFSITGSIPVKMAWTSSSTITIAAVACSGTCGSLATLSGLAIQTGTSGTITLNQPDGGQVLIGIFNSSGSGGGSAQVTITTALTTVGSILLIVGILILIVGVVLKSKSKAMAAPPMQAPGSDMSSDTQQPMMPQN